MDFVTIHQRMSNPPTNRERYELRCYGVPTYKHIDLPSVRQPKQQPLQQTTTTTTELDKSKIWARIISITIRQFSTSYLIHIIFNTIHQGITVVRHDKLRIFTSYNC